MPSMARLAGEQSVMHEMGIILHMANMLDETAKEQNLTKIGSVTLEVG